MQIGLAAANSSAWFPGPWQDPGTSHCPVSFGGPVLQTAGPPCVLWPRGPSQEPGMGAPRLPNGSRLPAYLPAPLIVLCALPGLGTLSPRTGDYWVKNQNFPWAQRWGSAWLWMGQQTLTTRLVLSLHAGSGGEGGHTEAHQWGRRTGCPASSCAEARLHWHRGNKDRLCQAACD